MNAYTPWVEKGQTELEYFKERFINARVELAGFDRELRAALETLQWASGPTREVKTPGLRGAVYRIESFLEEHPL